MGDPFCFVVFGERAPAGFEIIKTRVSFIDCYRFSGSAWGEGLFLYYFYRDTIVCNVFIVPLYSDVRFAIHATEHNAAS